MHNIPAEGTDDSSKLAYLVGDYLGRHGSNLLLDGLNGHVHCLKLLFVAGLLSPQLLQLKSHCISLLHMGESVKWEFLRDGGVRRETDDRTCCLSLRRL